MNRWFFILASILYTVLSFLKVQANVTLPNILAGHMVLQQKQAVPIWGKADPGERVTVLFSGQEATTLADASGQWKVSLKPMKANANPANMTITGNNTITLTDILIGEVWLCSGQSNMDLMMSQLKADKNPANDNPLGGPDENDPQLRLFKVEKKIEGNDVVTAGWHESTNTNVDPFSAVAYYFGKELRKSLGVPVGLVHSSWGGSRIEPWTDPQMYLSSPVFAAEAAQNPLTIDGTRPGNYYDGMIKPMIPFAIKGVLWYQGESNLMIHDEWRYADKMQLLIEGWRKAWGYDFSFYYVQLAPYLYSERNDREKHPTDYLAFYWEIQQAAQAIPKTGMVFITDLVNDLKNIHPIRKSGVGQRLSLWALAKDYGEKGIVYQSPRFKSMKIKGNTIEVTFTETAGGLVCKGDEPLWFSIAGADGNFVPAKAEIAQNKVIVSSNQVNAPTQVRYAWDEKAQTNLFGKTGLPVAPFRSNPETWNLK